MAVKHARGLFIRLFILQPHQRQAHDSGAYLSASELLRLHRAGGKRFINLFRTIGRCIQRAVQIQFQHPVFLADGGNAALFAVIYSPRGGDGHAAGCKA